MTRKWSDNEIERMFAEWRAADTADPPPFDATYAAARARSTKRAAQAPRRRVALAAAVLVVAGAGWLAFFQRAPQSPSRVAGRETPIHSLSEWRSPTAFLLRGPGDVLLTTVPTFSAESAELNSLGVRAGHRRPS